MPLTRLPALLEQITTTLQRGPAETWTDYDFEHLSDRLFERTGTRLSVTTLKRVFGRLTYRSSPSATTLNALARFAGHDDWRSYAAAPAAPAIESPNPAPAAAPLIPTATTASATEQPPAPAPRREVARPQALTKKYWWLLPVLLVVVALTGWLTGDPTAPAPPTIDPADYRFSSRKVRSEGVPNTVVFDYDARAAAGRRVRISQSWDTARSVVVSAYDSVHSSQYYAPGYFEAKLLVDDRIVGRHDLYVTAPDWVGTVRRPGRPIYLETEDFQRGDTLVVSERTLAAYNLPLEPRLPEIRLTKVPGLPALRTDEFTFTTTLRSDYNRGSGACQSIRVLLLCRNDAIAVPLRASGCTGEASLFALGTNHPAATTDLSGFGADLSQWTSLRIEGRDRRLAFLVNDQPALTLTVDVDPREIIGVSIRLLGPGRVRDTWLSGGGYRVEL